jgi:hypothetical protein
MMIETVVINVFGDTRQQFTPDPSWRSEFAAYLKTLPHDAHVQHYYLCSKHVKVN